MLCNRCGRSLGRDAQVGLCEECSKAQADAAQFDSSVAAKHLPDASKRNEHYGYAGIWLRFFAMLADGSLLAIVSLPLLNSVPNITKAISALFGQNTASPDNSAELLHSVASLLTAVIAVVFLQYLLGLVYYTAFEGSRLQSTPGKLLFGIRVEQLSGAPCSYPRAFARNLCKILSSITFGIGYLIAGVTQKKQALHDICTDTLVVQERQQPFALRAGLAIIVVIAYSAISNAIPNSNTSRLTANRSQRMSSTAQNRKAIPIQPHSTTATPHLRNPTGSLAATELPANRFTVAGTTIATSDAIAVFRGPSGLFPDVDVVEIYFFRTKLDEDQRQAVAALTEITSTSSIARLAGQYPVAALGVWSHRGPKSCTKQGLKNVNIRVFDAPEFRNSRAKLPVSIGLGLGRSATFSCDRFEPGGRLSISASDECNLPGYTSRCSWHVKQRIEIQ